MRSLILGILFLFTMFHALAQGNTFPSSGNVGIGATSPVSKLQVVSDTERETFRIYKSGNTSKYLSVWQGVGGTAIDPIGTGLLYLGYDQATIVTIGINGGSLGIGTASPYTHSRLHIKSSYSSPWSLLVESNTNDRIIGMSHDGAVGVIATSYLGSAGYSPIEFKTSNVTRISIAADGNVGIGTTAPDSKLTVKGVIHAEEVKVDLAVPGPDYVFDESYPLRSLEDTKAYIAQNKHLPGIPSSNEMQQNGVNLLEMNMKLLEKVEELTLHLIEMKGQNNALKLELLHVKEEIKELKSEMK